MHSAPAKSVTAARIGRGRQDTVRNAEVRWIVAATADRAMPEFCNKLDRWIM
jgi:hypothetical protein